MSSEGEIKNLARNWAGGYREVVAPTDVAPTGAPESPAFAPAPRRHVSTPTDTVQLQPPPAPVQPLTTSILAVLLPVLGAVISISLVSVMMAGASMAVWVSLPMALLSGSLGIYSYVSARQRHRAQVNERTGFYRAYLDNQIRELEAMRRQQWESSRVHHPDPQECVRRASLRDEEHRLWERSLGDADYLHLRLGVGNVPATFEVKLPQVNQTTAVDDLLKDAIASGKQFQVVPDSAVLLDLPVLGTVGLVGTVSGVQDVMRSILLQVATHHTPNQVKVAVVVPEIAGPDWLWARWLPHVWDDDYKQRSLGLGSDDAAVCLARIVEEIKKRTLLVSDQGLERAEPLYPIWVCVFGDTRPFEGPVQSTLQAQRGFILAQGPSVGVFSLIAAGTDMDVPRACLAQVHVESPTQGRLEIIGPPRILTDYRADPVPLPLADTFARLLAQWRYQGGVGASTLPAVVPLFDLLGIRSIEQINLAERWATSRPGESLEVEIGRRAGNEVFALNIHEKGAGPHGLVAGTTRSGKTVFMSSLMALLAAKYHPHDLNFLAIDYKGGDMIRDFVRQDHEQKTMELVLPHLVGVLTNLEARTMDRALLGLQVELRRRQEIFNQTGVGNISDYQAKRRAQLGGTRLLPLPRLVIVVDEFAELVRDQPDFMQGLVSVARVGGSLGIHLILATQNPAGIVNDQIWGNARFRICFRFGRSEDSRAVLRRPEAARIETRGRAYLQVGENEEFELFQAAYGGEIYRADSASQEAERHQVRPVDRLGRRAPSSAQHSGLLGSDEPNQLRVLSEHLARTAVDQGIPRLPNPWLPPLPAVIVLSELRAPSEGHGWNAATRVWAAPGSDAASRRAPRIVIGQVDDTHNKIQPRFAVDFAKGNLAVFGSNAAERSALLHTLAVSFAQDYSPAEAEMYLFDFGGRRLRPLRQLPHVVASVTPDETEMLGRAIRNLQRTLAARMTSEQSPTREKTTVVLIDNYAELVGASSPEVVDTLTKLAEQGPGFNMFIVLTNPSASVGFPLKISGHFAQALTFTLNDPNDYVAAVGRTRGLTPQQDIFGRALLRREPPVEVQIAQVVAGWTEEDRQKALVEWVSGMAEGVPSNRLAPIPEQVTLAELLCPAERVGWTAAREVARPVVLGCDLDLAEPWSNDVFHGHTYLVTGLAGGGRTSLIKTWMMALAEIYSRQQVTLMVASVGLPTLRELRDLPQIAEAGYAETVEHLPGWILALNQTITARQQLLGSTRAAVTEKDILQDLPLVVVAVDDIDEFWLALDPAQRLAFVRILRRGLGIRLVASVAVSHINDSLTVTNGTITTNLLTQLKANQTGFITGMVEFDSLAAFKIKLPAGSSVAAPVGRALFVKKGRWESVQLATVDAGDYGVGEWVAHLNERWQRETGANAPAPASEPTPPVVTVEGGTP